MELRASAPAGQVIDQQTIYADGGRFGCVVKLHTLVAVSEAVAGDAALADSFAATFDAFECFSRLVLDLMQWPNAAPHFYWGLYFFQTLQLAKRCEVGYVGLAKVHFDLERQHNKRISCTVPSWPAFLKPDREGCGKGALLAHMQCPLPPSQQPEVRCAAIASTGTSTRKPLLSDGAVKARRHAL